MTYTVLLAHPAGEVVGIGTASGRLAVGSSVPRIDQRIAGAASQAWTNTALANGALSAMLDGADVAEAIAQAISADQGRDYRQLGIIDRAGNAAAHTGSQCSPWAGHRLGPGYSILGNLLAGPQVLDAAEAALQAPLDIVAPSCLVPFIDTNGHTNQLAVPEPVGRIGMRILSALQAAERAGGDRRGPQSTALLVRRMGPQPAIPLTEIDLRVDDAEDPLAELRRMLALRLYDSRDNEVAPIS